MKELSLPNIDDRSLLVSLVENILPDKEEGELLISAEVFNKGLALATDVLLKVKLNGLELNQTKGLCTRKQYETTYQDGIQKQSGVVCNQPYGVITSAGIHIIKPQDVSTISFVYSEGVFLVKPAEIIFELYENGNLIKEKTYHMQYD